MSSRNPIPSRPLCRPTAEEVEKGLEEMQPEHVCRMQCFLAFQNAILVRFVFKKRWKFLHKNYDT